MLTFYRVFGTIEEEDYTELSEPASPPSGESPTDAPTVVLDDNTDMDIDEDLLSMYYAGMRFFRNLNFPDLRGHSRGNPRSGLIFMGGGGGGGVPYIVCLCVLADRQQCWNGTTYILIINLF